MLCAGGNAPTHHIREMNGIDGTSAKAHQQWCTVLEDVSGFDPDACQINLCKMEKHKLAIIFSKYRSISKKYREIDNYTMIKIQQSWSPVYF